MPAATKSFLSKYPFARLLVALVTGIAIQWYLQPPVLLLLAMLVISTVALAGFSFFSLAKKYTLRWLQGSLILWIILLSGAFITYLNDIRNQKEWFGNLEQKSTAFLVSLKEPPEQKPKSYKAIASVDAVNVNGHWLNTNGNILLYFQKENFQTQVRYGAQIIFKKPLQQIKNSGNPGAFDYKRYCLFQNITAQVYLKNDEFKILPDPKTTWFKRLLINARNETLAVLKNNIKGEKELGVAEALLIGYRTDLDKDLVQAYSNTGVVHIIAISGLHLGMIYGLLATFFSWFKKYRATRIIRPIVILTVLWMFTLLAGAAPSILRSAVMFSFIVVGEIMNRKTNMYNTLAASAFCMLIANPFTLWDVGFLLSYAAVISIVTFMMPVYKLLYFKNKILDKIWSLTSVTISAQVLTIPIVIFYFHQFPNLFLVTNLLVVPLSGFILYGEILLLILAPFPAIALWTGNLINTMISWMNVFIERINYLPFAVWNNLQISVLQTWLLYGVVLSLCYWLLQKSKPAFITAFSFLAILSISVSADIIRRNQQQQLIVYNVPKMSAVDIVQGKYFHFTGDSALVNDEALRNFYLKPSRVINRSAGSPGNMGQIPVNAVVSINNLRVLMIDNNFRLPRIYNGNKIPVDLLIISKNPPVYMSQLNNIFSFKKIVFDSSNPLWKTGLWKKDCDSLHLRFHSTADNGAYVMEL